MKTHISMLYNYFITAYRNIIRNKWFSLINVFGLASAMAIAMLIIAMKADQGNYDRFHAKGDRIYRVISESTEANATFASCPVLLEEQLNEQYAELEQATKIRRAFHHDINVGKGAIFTSGFYATSSFFNLFDFHLKHGNPITALEAPYSLILSEGTAEKLGINNAVFIGTSIEVKDVGAFTLTGIVKDNHERSHIYFDVLCSYNTFESLQKKDESKQREASWNDLSNAYLYLLLHENTNPQNIETALSEISLEQYPNPDTRIHFQLQALHDIAGKQLMNNLSVAIPDFVLYALSFLALLILLTACFNYTNLTIAKSIIRGKEIGIRKVIGAKRANVFAQFLMESIVLALFAFLFAILFLELFILPQIKSLFIFQALDLQLEHNWINYFFFFVFSVLTGLIAGLLPALHLSKFQPIQTLKSNTALKLFSKIGWRKALMGLQFVITVLFFITSILIFQQTKHMLYADYGFNQENIININLKGKDINLLKSELSRESSNIDVAGVSMGLGLGGKVTDICKKIEEGNEIVFDKIHIDENFIDLLDIQLLAGRNIQIDDPQDKSQVIINKTAVDQLGFETAEQAIGQNLLIYQEEGIVYSNIIGVTEDIYSYLILTKAEPLFMTYEPKQLGIASLKIRDTNIPKTVAAIESAWTDLFPEEAIDYYFYDEQLRLNLAPISSGVKILGFLTFITILIMSLGLLGLANYTVETRRKEISIRKILGADLSKIIWTLSRSMLQTLAIAMLIALPMAWFLNNLWLQNIAYRISLNVFNIGLGAFAIGLLAFLIIVSQSLWVANRNPVEALRNE